MSLLTVDIEKKLNSFLLKVQFEADSRDGFFGILGESGSGKSMTLRCIAGIETPDRGKILLNGRVLFDREKRINLPPSRRGVGYLFQDYALFPNMTPLQNIMIVLPKDKKQRKAAKAMRLLRSFGIEDCHHSRIDQLSGGQKQRVALARMLASKPELLLLDEPFAALDESVSFELEQMLFGKLLHYGKLTLFVSHDKGEIMRNCQNALLLSHGKTAYSGSVSTLFAKPQTLAAAKLCGVRNIFQIKRLSALTALIPALHAVIKTDIIPESTAFIGIPIDSFVFTNEEASANLLYCTVLRRMEDVDGTILLCRPETGDFSSPLLAARCPKNAVFSPGDHVHLQLLPERILFLRED